MLTSNQKQEMLDCQTEITKECNNCKKVFNTKQLIVPCEYGTKCPNPIVNGNLNMIKNIQL